MEKLEPKMGEDIELSEMDKLLSKIEEDEADQVNMQRGEEQLLKITGQNQVIPLIPVSPEQKEDGMSARQAMKQ